MTAIWFCLACGSLGTPRVDGTYICRNKNCRAIWFKVKS